MVSSFTNKFMVKEWQKVREKVLFDREKALLPATQEIVEEEIEKEKILVEIQSMDKLINEIYRRRSNLQMQYRMGGNIKSGERKSFIRACPVESCRGYLSTQWKCGLCNLWTCPDCNIVKGEIKDGDHQCKPDDLATAKLIASDTRTCPKCATGIFKIEGCDQMWCTQCHTPFSWKTGRIESNIHNPHYYEWLRRNGGDIPRNPDDIRCGRELNNNSFRPCQRDLRKIFNSDNIQLIRFEKVLTSIIESIVHLRLVQMPTYHVVQVENNLKWRIAFMRGFITEEVFVKNIQRDNKKYEKYREVHEVLQLFVQTVTDIMYRIFGKINEICIDNSFVIETQREKVLEETTIILEEIPKIRDYVNECLVDISATYSCVKYKIELYSPDIKTGNRVNGRQILQRV
jgi:ribosomal protein S27AE